MANPPHDDALLQLHVRHVPGGRFTEHVFNELKGATSCASRGRSARSSCARIRDQPIILVASGTGFAPIKAIIEHALHHGIDRPMTLYWGARARRDLYLDELPGSGSQQHPNFTFIPVLSEPAPEDALAGPHRTRPPAR